MHAALTTTTTERAMTSRRRPLLAGLSLLGLLFAAGVGTGAEPAAEQRQDGSRSEQRPNIVLIIADDISWNDLGCYGHPTLKTPHLDALATNGVRFTQAYLTTSSCSPSRCSIITGRYPHNTGAPELHTPLPEGQFLFPEALQQSGYYTVLSGKHHMGGTNSYASTGFDKISKGEGPGKEEDWVQMLRERPKDRPFFAWFAAVDAHRPWQYDEHAPRYETDQVVIPPYLIDNEATREDLTGYYHEVSRLDHYVGQVREELERQQIADNTMICFIADNGRPFPRCKTRLYDSGIKTPMLVAWPDRVTPAVTDSLVSVIDLAATFLDAAGLPASEPAQGVSLMPVLEDSDAVVREIAFAEHNWHVYQNHERMVRFGDYLYIRNHLADQANLCKEAYMGGAGESLLTAHREGSLDPEQQMVFRCPTPAEELFRVSSDPHQLENLVDQGEHAAALATARQLLDQWMAETADDVPTDLTPDRDARPDGEDPGEFRRGVFPGARLNATNVDQPGPIWLSR